jgi:hypothetical protein
VREKPREGEADGWTREGGGVRDWMGKCMCAAQEARLGCAREEGCARERLREQRTGWASKCAQRLDKRGWGRKALDRQAYMCWVRGLAGREKRAE